MIVRLTLMVCLAALVPARASAQDTVAPDPGDTIDYEVQPGDTCVRIAQRVLGDRRRTDALHACNPELGPPPHRLTPGMHLRIPRDPSAPSAGPDARVTQVERRVDARPPEREAWDRAARGLELHRGWRVATHERSSAELTFRDTTVVELRADTLVVVFGGTGGALRRGGTTAQLDRGTLRSRLGELSGRQTMTVESPGAQAELRGGTALVTVEEDGTARLANHEGGPATLRSNDVRGAAVRVPQGMGSQVRRGERPTRPRPLPAAPAWTGGERVRFLATAEGGTVLASWQPVEGAAWYRVEIARRADGREPVFATEVDASATRLEAHRVPPGAYFVRVSTIDREHFEGRPGEAREVRLEEARLEPAPEASDLIEDAPITVAAGTRMILPEGVTCAVAGEAPAGEVVLAPDVELTCVAADGTTVGPLDVEVRAAPEAPPPATVPAIVEAPPAAVAVTTPVPAVVPVALEPEPVAAPEILRDPPLPELTARIASAWSSPVRDDRARGVVFDQGGAVLVPADGDPQGRFALHAGVGLLDDVLRIDAGAVLDAGSIGELAHAGSGDVSASVAGYLHRADDVVVSAELGAWLPTNPGPEGLGRARLAPAVNLSLRVHPQVFVRVRQGALVDLSEQGDAMWAGSVALDVRVVDALVIGIESDFGAGEVGGDLFGPVAFVLNTQLVFGTVAVGAAIRGAATDDASRLWGQISALLQLRVLLAP